ncbi:MAG: TIGR02996 domain-containing protein [Kofleriaceae bacterium]
MLAELLEAWRSVRHPRIADAIELMSGELAAAAGPIRGKTAAAIEEAWLAIAARREPAELGRLLAMPWPSTWQKAMPRLEALLAWPDDPRLALAFARTLDTVPFDVLGAVAFYTPMLARIVALRDPRTVAILVAGLVRDKPRYYARQMRALEEQAVAALVAMLPPVLAPDVESRCAQIEQRFAASIERAARVVRDEAAYLAAIHANPGDLAARAVYGDFLQERGDPRGELIALQLASAGADVQRKLLVEHGRTWAGSLDPWFEREGRRFEAGFLAGGLVKRFPITALTDAMMADPAWRLVRSLEGTGWGDQPQVLALSARPELANLREIHGLDDVAARQLAGGPPRALRELTWILNSPDPDSPLAVCEGLPELQTIGFTVVGNLPEWFAEAPVLARVERLVMRVSQHVTGVLELVAARAGRLRTLELVTRSRGSLADDAGWRVVLTRESAPGPFTGLAARYRTGRFTSPWHLNHDLVNALKAIPAAWLRSATFDAGGDLAIPSEHRATLAAAVARFPQLEGVVVPWAPPAQPSIGGRVLELSLDGPALLAPDRIATVLRLFVDALGQRYDNYVTGDGSSLHSLGTDPAARIARFASARKLEDLNLRLDGHPQRLELRAPRRRSTLSTTLATVVVDRPCDDIFAWLLRVLDSADIVDGWLDAPGHRPHGNFDLRPYGPARAAWVLVLAPIFLPVLPGDELARRGIAATITRRHVVLRNAATPEAVTVERLREIVAGVRAVVEANIAAHVGYDFAALVIAALGPAAAARKLALEQATPTRVAFTAPDNRQLVAELWHPLAAARLRVTSVGVNRAGRVVGDLRWVLVDSRTRLAAALASATGALRTAGGSSR